MSEMTQKHVDSANDHLSKETNDVKPIAEFKKEKIRWVEVEHGYDDSANYVWHFTDHHAQRTFPKGDKNLHRIWNIISGHLDKVIPKEVVKEAIPSPADWEKQVFTVKALKVGKIWNFDEDEAEGKLKVICEELSDLIENSVVRKEYL